MGSSHSIRKLPLPVFLHFKPQTDHAPPTPTQSLFLFLHKLRQLLRLSSASCLLTFPSHLYASQPSLLSRLSHTSDAVLSLSSFAASPTALATFPRHQGLLHIPKLPAVNGLVPPSAKLSVMRGLGGGGEGRENNLGFRVKRRRFVVETVVDEPMGAEEKKQPASQPAPAHEHEHGHSHAHERKPVLAPAVVEETKTTGSFVRKVQLEGAREAPRPPPRVSASAIIHKRPELYEF